MTLAQHDVLRVTVIILPGLYRLDRKATCGSAASAMQLSTTRAKDTATMGQAPVADGGERSAGAGAERVGVVPAERSGEQPLQRGPVHRCRGM